MPARPPKATVAIPVYNSAATLARSIASACRQTLSALEILVADDGSTDASAAVAEASAGRDSRIRVIRLSPNRGKPRAMNVLVEQARGEWIAVLDADDAFHPARLEKLIAAGEAADVALAADNLYCVDAGTGQIVRTAFDPAAPPQRLDKHVLAAHADSWADFDYGILKPVVRRRFVTETGVRYYEDTKLAEDFYYLMSCLVRGATGCMLSEPLYYWTLPFGPVSRRWTQTGHGAWRYDYRSALRANAHFLAEMRARSEDALVAMLQVRGRQYAALAHYTDARRAAAEGRWLRALATIGGHPATWRPLARRGGAAAVRLAGPAGARWRGRAQM